MNKQYNPDTGERGVEWTHRFGLGSGRTWNVGSGCKHDCQWRMPDGALAQCYAKTTAERWRSETFFPLGFEHYTFQPERLEEPLKEKKPCGIFMDSMADLMGHWVPDDHIRQVLDICRRASWHTFFLLTKNPPRLAKFEYPSNVWVGISAPPSIMNGKALSLEQQKVWTLVGLRDLEKTNAAIRWMSIEPLSFDIAPLLVDARLHWAVIGAATRGSKVYQPNAIWVRNVLAVLDRQNIPVFFKGNLRGNPAALRWREEYPVVRSAELPVQLEMNLE